MNNSDRTDRDHLKKGGTINFQGEKFYMNDSDCIGSTGFFGSFLFVEKLHRILFQNVTVTYSRFSDNYATYGGVFGFSETLLNLETLMFLNNFTNNSAESKINKLFNYYHFTYKSLF